VIITKAEHWLSFSNTLAGLGLGQSGVAVTMVIMALQHLRRLQKKKGFVLNMQRLSLELTQKSSF